MSDDWYGYQMEEDALWCGLDAPRIHPAGPVEMWDALWRRALLEQMARKFAEDTRRDK